ncbi:hypothetical protein Pmar_PMAR015218 [Perkinsus marinus ATCC 50983]|uniref:Uncharacterized protein n=1 Tax=Perkinsus marinus (strain ATCC 50983 / TXsc) TaxID=423536 RepID=C5LRA7_PERM5|nr:hypothetical protein Pmar_PMAR015218 [Perkinsus marinus ATCC 50983]EER00736.1 hypothetical protein Pmar_PMAR015218 [Perkinsus marinus ATCC 50983]|eukprot:XP_002768018.1 hypothetical protein Pmar_PMAR015218 [Perkinsus marinus ATCC 50983]
MGCFSSKPEETNEPTTSKDTAAATTTPTTTHTGMDIDHTDPKLLPSAQCIEMPAELLEKDAAIAKEEDKPAAAAPAEKEEVVDPKLLPSAQTIAQPVGFVLEAQKKEAEAQQATAAAASKQ